MDQMVDSETRDHGIEWAESWQRVVQIMFDNRDSPIASEILPQIVEHGWREVDGHELGLRVSCSDERKQSPGAAAEIENAPWILRNEFNQGRFTLRAMGNGVRAAKIVESVFG
jgi:hypothetical protein